MADLSVNICGIPFKNPVIPASGVFGYGREYEQFYDLSNRQSLAARRGNDNGHAQFRRLAESRH